MVLTCKIWHVTLPFYIEPGKEYQMCRGSYFRQEVCNKDIKFGVIKMHYKQKSQGARPVVTGLIPYLAHMLEWYLYYATMHRTVGKLA